MTTGLGHAGVTTAQWVTIVCCYIVALNPLHAADQEVTRVEPVSRLQVREYSEVRLTEAGDHLIYRPSSTYVLYNLKTRRPRFEINTDKLDDFAISHDLKYAAAISRSGIETADIRKRTWKPLDLVNCRGYAVAFSPDGKLIAAVISNEDLASRIELIIWSFKTREIIHRDSISKDVLYVKLAFTSDSKQCLVRFKEINYPQPEVLIRFDLSSGTQHTLPFSNCEDFACTPEANIYLLSNSLLGYSSTTHKQVWKMETPTVLYQLGFGIAEDGPKLLLGSKKQIHLWLVNAKDGIKRTLNAHEVSVDAATVSRDGKWLVTAGGDHRVRIWDFNTLEPRAWFRPGDALVNQLLFTADDTQLLMKRGNQIEFWKTAELLALNSKP